VSNCSYHRQYATKHVYRYFLFCCNSGHDVFNSVIRWHPAWVGYPTSIRDLAYIWEPASIRSFTVCYIWWASATSGGNAAPRLSSSSL